MTGDLRGLLRGGHRRFVLFESLAMTTSEDGDGTEHAKYHLKFDDYVHLESEQVMRSYSTVMIGSKPPSNAATSSSKRTQAEIPTPSTPSTTASNTQPLEKNHQPANVLLLRQQVRREVVLLKLSPQQMLYYQISHTELFTCTETLQGLEMLRLHLLEDNLGCLRKRMFLLFWLYLVI